MIYKSNVDQVISRLKHTLSLDGMDPLFLEISQNMFASNMRRVHNEGRAVSGSPIGKYSTTPIYVNPTKVGVRKFPLKGKTGRTKFNNGALHKTGYFSNGYLGFKRKIGFGSKVNAQVTGRLKADWTLLKSRSGYVIGFKSKYGKNISEGLEDRFDTRIWGVSKQDRKLNNELVKKYLSNA